MFSASDLLWVKNIKRDRGEDWAYMDLNVGSSFSLDFPNNKKWYPTNYSKPQPNELILLFQTVNTGLNNSPVTYLTHLVTPIDRTLVDDRDPHRPYKRLVAIIAKPNFPIIKPNGWSFFKPNRGQICSIDKIERETMPDLSIQQKQEFFFNLFQEILVHYDAIIRETQNYEIGPDVIISATEGKEIFQFKLHRIRERNKEIVISAKQRARENNRVFCEVCSFNFTTTYPELGTDFIECHHKTPIAQGGVRTTTIDDLALVCSNCHRMLHKKFNEDYLTVDEMRTRFFRF